MFEGRACRIFGRLDGGFKKGVQNDSQEASELPEAVEQQTGTWGAPVVPGEFARTLRQPCRLLKGAGVQGRLRWRHKGS